MVLMDGGLWWLSWPVVDPVSKGASGLSLGDFEAVVVWLKIASSLGWNHPPRQEGRERAECAMSL